MLKLVEVAQYLTNKFNEIGALHTPAYTFNVQAEVGANKNGADVQGIVKTDKPKLPPVLAGRNATYNLVVELSVVAPTSNFNLKNIEEIVNSFASQVNGQEIAFEHGKGLVTLTLGSVAEFKVEVGQGGIVPLSFNMVINYTEGVATSRSRHWLLDGVEIPYLKEGVYITKEGRTNKINGKKYSETFALGQQKRYRFVLPYDETSVICQTLQKDILDGDGNKTYVLTYYDNVHYTENEPYQTTVMLFENADSESTKPEIAQFTITFADADDGNHTTKYYLALMDNPFDEATENTKCFEDTIENNEVVKTAYENQIDYYDDFIDEHGVPENEIPACNLSSIYLTNQTYVNTQGTDLFKIVNKNYARIRVETIENGQSKEYYYYYWTKNVQIGMDGQVTFDLKLDSLQTFLFQDGIKFEGNLIERACLNRWKEVTGDPTSVVFDGDVTSKLFERENLQQVAKRLVSRERLKVHQDLATDAFSANPSINAWIDENILAWCYIMISPGDYKIGWDGSYNSQGEPTGYSGHKLIETKMTKSSNDIFVYPYSVLCYPIMKSAYAKLYIQKSGETTKNEINYAGFGNFLNLNDGWAKVHNVKLSIKPPFDLKTWNTNSYISDGSNFTIITTNAWDSKAIQVGDGQDYLLIYDRTVGDNVYKYGILNITQDNPAAIPMTIELKANFTLSNLPKIKFYKSAIRTSNKDKKFNPKLNGADYKELQLTFGGSTYSYDIQKLNNENPVFNYFEELTADVTKGLVQYAPTDTNNVFSQAYKNSFNGFAYTNDLSMPYATNQLDTYLANNKNFYQAFQNQQERQRMNANFSALSGVLGGLTSAGAAGAAGGAAGVAASATTGVAGGLISGIVNYKRTLKDQEYQVKQRDLTVDDMKSAPNVMQNVNGNALLQGSICDLGVYAEVYEALPHELEMANDDMFMNGFTYNIDDDIFPYINDTTSKHIRKNFNYIQALIGNISGVTISNEARDDLRQRLANGVRFWHIDNIDYEHENYERWLEA